MVVGQGLIYIARNLDIRVVARVSRQSRFTLNGAPFMAIAGIFREANGANPPSYTMLTTEPGEDVKPFHNRQVVVVRPENWSAWLHLSKPEAELLRPLPAGSLAQETVLSASD